MKERGTMVNILDYLEYLALQEELQQPHYKALLLLLKKPQTQATIGKRLGLLRQNINKIFRSLEEGGYIEVDRIEGRNKFYRVVTDIQKLENVMHGQLEIK